MILESNSKHIHNQKKPSNLVFQPGQFMTPALLSQNKPGVHFPPMESRIQKKGFERTQTESSIPLPRGIQDTDNPQQNPNRIHCVICGKYYRHQQLEWHLNLHKKVFLAKQDSVAEIVIIPVTPSPTVSQPRKHIKSVYECSSSASENQSPTFPVSKVSPFPTRIQNVKTVIPIEQTITPPTLTTIFQPFNLGFDKSAPDIKKNKDPLTDQQDNKSIYELLNDSYIQSSPPKPKNTLGVTQSSNKKTSQKNPKGKPAQGQSTLSSQLRTLATDKHLLNGYAKESSGGPKLPFHSVQSRIKNYHQSFYSASLKGLV